MPVKLFNDQKPLKCAHCGKDLFEKPSMSIVVIVEDENDTEIKDIYACCKGECDRILKRTRVQKNYDGWKDLTEFMNPVLFLKHWMAMMNNMYDGKKMERSAYDNYKQILLSTAPYVMRELSNEELEDAVNDSLFPY